MLEGDTQRLSATAFAFASQMYHSQRELDNLSPATREAVEAEVKELLVTAEGNAKRIRAQRGMSTGQSTGWSKRIEQTARFDRVVPLVVVAAATCMRERGRTHV